MNKLKELRIKNNYNLTNMSEKLNISKTFYWQIENNKRRLSYIMAIKIADIFEIKPDQLFYEDFKSKN